MPTRSLFQKRFPFQGIRLSWAAATRGRKGIRTLVGTNPAGRHSAATSQEREAPHPCATAGDSSRDPPGRFSPARSTNPAAPARAQHYPTEDLWARHIFRPAISAPGSFSARPPPPRPGPPPPRPGPQRAVPGEGGRPGAGSPAPCGARCHRRSQTGQPRRCLPRGGAPPRPAHPCCRRAARRRCPRCRRRRWWATLGWRPRGARGGSVALAPWRRTPASSSARRRPPPSQRRSHNALRGWGSPPGKGECWREGGGSVSRPAAASAAASARHSPLRSCGASGPGRAPVGALCWSPVPAAHTARGALGHRGGGVDSSAWGTPSAAKPWETFSFFKNLFLTG